MLNNQQLNDAQAALGFLISQTAHIESQVWEKKYPDITYPQFVPVDNSAHPWAKSVTYYSSDKAGKADLLHHRGQDFPLVSVNRTKHETEVTMGGIGYDYDLEEINQARMLGINLTADEASAARRAYEEYCEQVAYTGDDRVGFTGLLNNASVSAASVADPDDEGVDTTWETKSADYILTDINAAITGIWTASKTVELSDTILLPLTSLALINNKRLDTSLETTVLDYVKRTNIYTMQTGQPIKIMGLRQLETAGESSAKRMVTYKRDPEVVKMHIPKPLEFLPPQQQLLRFIVPGIFRLGGVDIRRPGAVRYSDGI